MQWLKPIFRVARHEEQFRLLYSPSKRYRRRSDRNVSRWPEAITHGQNREEAIGQAKVALAVALFGYLKEGQKAPTPKRRRGEQIAPQTTDVLKIAVVEAWMDSGFTKSEFARMLDIDEKEARRILDPDAATKADRLEEALSVLGRKVHIAVEAA